MRLWCLVLWLAAAALAGPTPEALRRQAEDLIEQGRYAEARAAAEQAVALDRPGSLELLARVCHLSGELGRARELYAEQPGNFRCLLGLAELANARADFSAAGALAHKALALVQAPGDVAQVLRVRAAIARDGGDYGAAEADFRKALKLVEKRPLETANCLEELAGLHFMQGQREQALAEWDRVLGVYQKAYGTDSPLTARVVAHEGTVYAQLGNLKLAEEVLLVALNVLEETPGRDHLDTVDALQSLALVYVRTGRYPPALGMYRRALKVYENRFGPTHPSTVLVVQNLAHALHAAGQLDEAERTFARALELRGADNPVSAYALENLATVKLDRRDLPAAAEFGRQAEAAFTRLSEHWLSFTGEDERLAFLNSLHHYTIYAAAGSAPDLAQAVLRWKGLALDSLAEDQRLAQASRDPNLRALVERVRSADSRYLKSGGEDLAEQARAGRAELARAVAGLGQSRRALQVTVAQVQAALPSDAALVELVSYLAWAGAGRPAAEAYGAVVILPTGSPQWIPLGDGNAVNSAARDFVRAVRAPDIPLERSLRTLYDRVWAPVQAALPSETRTVILSPDGYLNLVSFAGLQAPDGTLVAERYDLLYVASGRDLLAPRRTGGQGLLAVGNPAYGEPRAAVGKGALRALGTRLAPLPGTESEVKRLAVLGAEWKPEVWLGAQASESRLRGVRSPRILHLATHGFYLGSGDTSPMERSGVALAGAQSTLASWARGEVPSAADDGILTAREAAGLHLDETWLVALSACDSGLGEAWSGEGVLGLRRALALAGSQNLLLTLWPVPDVATADFMLDFYAALKRNASPPRALAEVQRAWLTRLRAEKGVAWAVRTGGAFVVTFQGAL